MKVTSGTMTDIAIIGVIHARNLSESSHSQISVLFGSLTVSPPPRILLRSESSLLSNNALVHFVHDFTLLLLHQVFDVTVKLRYLLFNEHLVFREVELVDIGEGFAKHVRLIVRHNVELIS